MKDVFLAHAYSEHSRMFLGVYQGNEKDIEAYVLEHESCPEGVCVRAINPIPVEEGYAKDKVLRKLNQKRIALEKALQDINVKITFEEQ